MLIAKDFKIKLVVGQPFATSGPFFRRFNENFRAGLNRSRIEDLFLHSSNVHFHFHIALDSSTFISARGSAVKVVVASNQNEIVVNPGVTLISSNCL